MLQYLPWKKTLRQKTDIDTSTAFQLESRWAWALQLFGSLFRGAPSKVAPASLVDAFGHRSRTPLGNPRRGGSIRVHHNLALAGTRGKTSMVFQMLRLCGRSGRARVETAGGTPLAG